MELGIDNIFSQEDIENLFNDEGEETKETKESTQDTPPEEKETKEINNETETTEELNVEGLFEGTPESVGSEEHQEGEDTDSERKPGSSSPKQNNFYSSFAKALKEDGVFPDLDDKTVDDIKEAEDLAEVIEAQIQARLDEKQRRIDEALNAGVEGIEIKQYENTIAYLDSITEEALLAEDDKGAALRRQIISQDLLNRGYSREEAEEELKDIFDNGSDVRKAKRALASNKDFFKSNYKKLIDDAKAEAEEEEKERKQQSAQLKKAILEDKEVFGELKLDKATRQKVYDNISKPVYKDKETGELYTALQKYEMENKTEFLKNVGLIFTLTDGFKNLDSLTKSQVRKEVRKGLRELEHTLNNTSRNSDGNLKFVSSVSEDPESFIGKWDVDI